MDPQITQIAQISRESDSEDNLSDTLAEPCFSEKGFAVPREIGQSVLQARRILFFRKGFAVPREIGQSA